MAIRQTLLAVLLAGLVFPAQPSMAWAGGGLDLGGLKEFIRRHVLGDEARQPAPVSGRNIPAVRRTAVGHHAVPLPRPRPLGLVVRNDGAPISAGRKNGTPPAAPVATTRTGRIVVKVENLGKERDSYSAVYLAPKERGSWSHDAVRKARRRCEIVLAATNVDAEPVSPIGGPKGCGIAAPVKVRSLGAVRVSPPGRFNCTMTAALYKWVTDVVQPAARARFKQPVVEIREFASYSCRRRGGITKGPVRISEHAFGNAIDVAEFRLADGTRISVLKDWGGFSALFNRKAAFLREVHKKACGIFSTVLGPEANKAHRNHFHFDLGRGGRYKYCH